MKKGIMLQTASLHMGMVIEDLNFVFLFVRLSFVV